MIRKRNAAEVENSVANEVPKTSAIADNFPAPANAVNNIDIIETESDSDSDSEPLAKKGKKIYKQKFRSEWKEQFPHLINKNDSPYCNPCDKKITCNIHLIKRYE